MSVAVARVIACYFTAAYGSVSAIATGGVHLTIAKALGNLVPA